MVYPNDPEKTAASFLVRPDGAELHAPSRGSTGGRELKMVKIDVAGLEAAARG